MTIKYKADKIEGLSTDTKPSNHYSGRVFYETDTGKTYDLLNGTWTERSGGAQVTSNLIQTYSETIGDYTTPTTATQKTDPISNSGTFYITPNTTSVIDGDSNTKTAMWKRSGHTGYQLYDFGSSASRSFSFKFGYDMKQGGTCTVYLQYSTDGSSWNTQYTASTSSSTETTVTENFTVTARYLKFYVTSSAASEEARGYMYECTGLATVNSIFDDDTSSSFTSPSDTNYWIYVDMGVSSTMSHIAIYHNSSTTETEYAIQTSTNASDWTSVRTITTSNLTTDSWNYIRFNLVSARYVRVYGNSGSAGIIALNGIKVLNGQTDNDILFDHAHQSISATDTSLGLDGT